MKKIIIVSIVVAIFILLAVYIKFSEPIFAPSALTQQETTNELISYIQKTIESLKQQVSVLLAQQSGTNEDQKINNQQDGEPATILGCLDETALNYNPNAKKDDGGCTFSNATLETNRTYFIKTTGEDFILQTLVYVVKPSPYYNKSYAHPKELNYTINGENLTFLTDYFANSCVQNLSIPGCSDIQYQYYTEPNIVIPKDSVLNVVDLPNKIGAGAFYLSSVILKGVTTGKTITLGP